MQVQKSPIWHVFLALALVLLLGKPFLAYPQGEDSAPSPRLTAWKVVKSKVYPQYKVEILERWTTGKWPRRDSMKARIVPKEGGAVTEYTGTWLTPDPREFVVDWKEGRLLDVTGDKNEDLVLRNSTGGAHCCYNYVIFSLTKPLRQIGNIEMQDCGEKIRLHDLNGNGKPEIISCDARFTYLGDLPYSESPFPPAIYTLGLSGYERADKAFKPVYQQDIKRLREILQRGYKPSVALQIVTDYFMMGNEKKGWEEFEALYKGKDKDKIRVQLAQKLGSPGVPASDGESQPAVKSSP
jgi:hypothetical protein